MVTIPRIKFLSLTTAIMSTSLKLRPDQKYIRYVYLNEPNSSPQMDTRVNNCYLAHLELPSPDCSLYLAREYLPVYQMMIPLLTKLILSLCQYLAILTSCLENILFVVWTGWNARMSYFSIIKTTCSIPQL